MSFLFPSSSPKLLTTMTYEERRGIRTFAPWVPSPDTVVEAMLDLADLTADDTLMDMGCGDGRIVFAAARRGARAVGVDIDPVFVAENRVIASSDPAYAKVSFVCADMATADLSEATVITCYLMPYSMELLKPKFETALKPGTRIVSHAFNLWGWEPLRKVDPPGRLGTVYLWVV